VDKCGHRGLRCDPNYFFIINVISLSSIKFCLSIYGVVFYLGDIFEFIYFIKYHIFYINYAYFYVLFFFNFFLTTLKYHSNKLLELKPKDEVTLLSCYFTML